MRAKAERTQSNGSDYISSLVLPLLRHNHRLLTPAHQGKRSDYYGVRPVWNPRIKGDLCHFPHGQGSWQGFERMAHTFVEAWTEFLLWGLSPCVDNLDD
jgi:hypothetical protein